MKKLIVAMLINLVCLSTAQSVDSPGECGGKIGYGKQCVAMKTCPGSNQRCPQRDGIDFDYYQGWNDPMNDVGRATGMVRNQGWMGSCARYGYTTMVCQEMVRLGVWKDKKTHCSPLDFHLWYYNNKNKNGTADQLTSANAVESFDVTDVLEFAKSVGFCPESNFRSDWAENPWLVKPGDNAEVRTNKLLRYEGANPLIVAGRQMAAYREQYRKGVNRSLADVCWGCRKLAPRLTDSDWGKVQEVLLTSNARNSEGAALQAVTKINELACPPEQRVKLPKQYVISAFSDNHFGNQEYQHIQETMGVLFRLNKPRTVQAAIDPRLLDPEFEIKKDESASHSVDIIGASCDALPSDKSKNPTYLKCFYYIQNSWGRNCEKVPKEKFGDHAKCYGDSGLIMIEQEYLFQGPYKINSFNYVVDEADGL